MMKYRPEDMHGYLSDELTHAGILAFFVIGSTLTSLQQHSAGSSFHFENCIKLMSNS